MASRGDKLRLNLLARVRDLEIELNSMLSDIPMWLLVRPWHSYSCRLGRQLHRIGAHAISEEQMRQFVVSLDDESQRKAFNEIWIKLSTARAELAEASRPVHGIFISYRRSDESAFAGRLCDRLSAKFGEKQIFMDVDSIEMGVDFVDALKQTLSCCKAMLVVIGKKWETASNTQENRRLEGHDDFVRMEIEAALERNVRVIPILVDGAEMPHSENLPRSIRALVRRQSHEMSHVRFGSDCQELILTIEQILKATENNTL